MNADVRKAIKGVLVFVVVCFAIIAFFGILMGVADPNGGWAPWRVGLLAGSIGAACALVLGAVGALMWFEDQASSKE